MEVQLSQSYASSAKFIKYVYSNKSKIDLRVVSWFFSMILMIVKNATHLTIPMTTTLDD